MPSKFPALLCGSLLLVVLLPLPAAADGLPPLPPLNNDLSPIPVGVQQGSQVRLNGRTLNVAWGQWQNSQGTTMTGLSDSGLLTRFGWDLQNSNDASWQPILWFGNQPFPLPTRFSPTGEYRWLEITALATQNNWQILPQGTILQINTPPARITAMRVARQPWGERLVLELDRPTPWSISRLTNSRDAIAPRELALSLEATLDPQLARNFKLPPAAPIRNLKIETATGRTTLAGAIAGHLRPQVSMLSQPNRLVVDIRPENLQQRNILWAPGVRWREDTLSLGSRRYPLTWLEINPHQPGVRLQPIWNDPSTLVGIQPLAQIAQRWQVAAAINGGFFNRQRQFPLGAIRQQGNWISSPILNRGAIAWNDNGEFKIGRLSLQQTLITNQGQRLAIVALDSGFVQKGMARYTRNWGGTYTPMVKTETVVSVVNDQVVGQQRASAETPTPIPIPANGYLLVLRDVDFTAALPNGTAVQLEMTTAPADFNRFPQILGAGPLLVEAGQIVLNPVLEQFGKGLDAQLAPRSGIGQRADGTVLLVTTHNRIGGPGPSLTEWAQILRSMGAVNALNLDGGSSSALYLGGQLLDRHPVTTTRVQNGIGLFIRPNS